jgi:hypothetical protein
MRKVLAGSLFALAAATAHADPAVMFGINYNFGGGGPGLSVKVLSSDRQDRTVGSVGASYYPMMNRVGLDVGFGRTFENGAATVGWDVINNAPQASIGYVDTRR